MTGQQIWWLAIVALIVFAWYHDVRSRARAADRARFVAAVGDERDHELALRLRRVTPEWWAMFDGCVRPDSAAVRPADAGADWSPPLVGPTLAVLPSSLRDGRGVTATWTLPIGVGVDAIERVAPLLADSWGVDQVRVSRPSPGRFSTDLLVRGSFEDVALEPDWDGAA